MVLSNMGQHKQALEIYVFKMKDFDKAEEYAFQSSVLTFTPSNCVPRYCNRVHLQSDSAIPSAANRPTSTSEVDESLPSIYHTLLSLYLTPPPPHKPNWPPALNLLSKHGSRLPASSTLSLIPATLPVKELEDYFRGRIRAANSIVNEARVVAGLRKSEVVRAQASLLLGDEGDNGQADLTSNIAADGTGSGRNRHVIVSEERVCGVCHKRLGRSVVSVLPDNTVVHYACSKRAVQKGMSSGGLGNLRKDAGNRVHGDNSAFW